VSTAVRALYLERSPVGEGEIVPRLVEGEIVPRLVGPHVALCVMEIESRGESSYFGEAGTSIDGDMQMKLCKHRSGVHQVLFLRAKIDSHL